MSRPSSRSESRFRHFHLCTGGACEWSFQIVRSIPRNPGSYSQTSRKLGVTPIITLIVCRLIVVTLQVWRGDHSLRKVSVWNLATKTARRTGLFPGGTRGTSWTAPQLCGRGRARRTERGFRKHRKAGKGTFGRSERPLYRLFIAISCRLVQRPVAQMRVREAIPR